LANDRMKPQYTYAPAPLPGTGAPPHALFVDRWGTLLERPQQGFCEAFAEVSFTPGALDLLFRACQAGWTLYLIGNEDGVAQGSWTDKAWQAFEAELLAHLTALGIGVRRNYACLDHPEGKGKHRRDSVFLFPNTGAMYHAAQTDGIRLGESWVIGDSTLELSAGWRAGCRLAGVQSGLGLADGGVHVEPEVVCADLTEALTEILAVERMLRR
jgi:histidinol-phosphate phosphatase family protein